jgi:WD40 repeat protein
MNILRRICSLTFFFLILANLAEADELELVLQAGHSQTVTSVVWLDDQHLVSGSDDGSLKLWNVTEQRVKRTMWPPLKEDQRTGELQSIGALVKTDDGVWALHHNQLRLWNPVDGELKKSLSLPEGYTGDDLKLVADESGALYIYGTQDELLKIVNGTVSEKIKTPKFSTLSVSSDGSTIAGVTYDGLVYGSFQDLKPLPETFANRWGVDQVLLSADGRKLNVAASVNWVEAWDLTNESLVFQVPVNQNAPTEETLKGSGFSSNDLGLSISDFGPDSILGITLGGEAFLIDRVSGEVSPLFNYQKFGITTVSASSDLKGVSGGLRPSGTTGVPLAVREADGWNTTELGGRGLSFTELESQDDTLFLSAGSDFVLSYDLSTGQPSHTYHTGYFPATLLTPTTLYCGGNDGVLYAYDIRSGQELWQKTFVQSGAKFGEGILALELSPDGRQVAVSVFARNQSIVLVDALTGEVEKEIPSKNVVRALAYSRDGQKMYFSDFESVKLFDIGYGKVVHSWKKGGSRLDQFVSVLNHPNQEAVLGVTRRGEIFEYNPADLEGEPGQVVIDGIDRVQSAKTVGSKLLLTAGHGAALVDLEGKVLKTYGSHLSSTADALALDKVVITTGWDSQVLVWDRNTGRQLATLLALDQAKNWLFITSDFHFDGTDEAQALIEWRWNGKLYELGQFYERFYQPGLLARTINLSTTAPPKTAPQLGKQPPKVKLLPPKELEAGTYEVNIQTEATLPDGTEVRLYHNGHRVAGTAPYKIKAVEGENRLRASAFNADRTVESEPDRLEFVSKAPTAEQTLHIFAAAVNDYPNRLDFAVQDAKSFVGAFEPGLYDNVKKTTLYDNDASKTGIINALKAIECEPQDTLLIFLAGHGTIIDNKFHFIPHGSDGKASETSLSSAELGQILASLPATRQVLFLDTCHAGASAKDLAELLVEKETPLIASQQGSALIKDQKVLARQAGTFLVAGSTPNATAAEVPELGHGLFTYAVLNGLQGDLGTDNDVTVNELLRYLSQQVPELSMKFRGNRHGIWQFSAGQDFPIARPK